uniref:Ribosomal protein S10 n=1 Tax=Histiona aroides TaxID=392300 RepID=M4Q9F3_HISAR|nr:ribosomal protein S10 [Histiona aroides]AGH24047.1 ribosomal protein S10 [Histiona aroides]
MKLTKCVIHTHSFDIKLISTFCDTIKNILNPYTQLTISGPIMLPTSIKKITVNRSPHIDKKSREQFEIRTYSRALQIETASKEGDIVEVLKKIRREIPVGLDIKVVFTYKSSIIL